jgi:ORF6N domain
MTLSKNNVPVIIESVSSRILVIRGQKTMLDADLAEIYSVPTKRFNEQVKRNLNRFPTDFMFQLTKEEKAEVVANCDHLARLKYSPHLPYAFTEHGAIMAATILNSPKAIEMSVFIVRAFIGLRSMLTSHNELSARLDELERKISDHDGIIGDVLEAVQQLMALPVKQKPSIGFTSELEK